MLKYYKILIAMNKQLLFIMILAFLITEDVLCICDTCPLPRHPQTKSIPLDGTIDVLLKDNAPPIYGVTSVQRVTIKKYGKLIQGIKIYRKINGLCTDTVLVLDDVDKLYSSNLGIGGATLNIPVLPAREYYFDETKTNIKYNVLSFLINTSYFGQDKSKRKIGTDGISYGANLFIYPFKNTFGSKIKLGLGTGINVENGRARVPILASIRLNFLGSEYEEEFFNYYPNSCKFAIEGESPISPNNPNLIEIPTKEKVDSTVYFFIDKKVIKDEYRPYIFLNGGLFLDTDFDGSGSEPSINKNDYNQYGLQFGIGMPLYDILDISLGISYNRFNLRTPCTSCQNYYVVNTNNVIGFFMNIGIYLNY